MEYVPMRREYDRSAVFDDAVDAVPQESASFGIHSCRRFIL